MEEARNPDIGEVYDILKTLIENQRLIIDLIKELKTEQEKIKEELKLSGILSGLNIISRREMMN